jgi:hypothetical protein
MTERHRRSDGTALGAQSHSVGVSVVDAPDYGPGKARRPPALSGVIDGASELRDPNEKFASC